MSHTIPISFIPDTQDHSMLEGLARVVAVEGNQVRLEPEQSSSCGHCASAAICGDKGIGTLASRLETRRFALPNELSLAIGDRVVLGIQPQSFIAASALAYVLPLMLSLICAGLAQWQAGRDGITLFAALTGLLGGFAVVRLVVGKTSPSDEAEFRVLRRAAPEDQCN
jgi:sigma-E factor negative regulatory protein RseC